MTDNCFEQVTTVLSYLLLIITFPVSIFFCLKVVSEYERIVIFRLGRLHGEGPKGPGLMFILPCIDNYIQIDLRTVTVDVLPQEILSKDSVSVSVDAVLYYKVFDPLNAVLRVHNYSYSTSLLAATVLRNILGTKALSEILLERKAISQGIKMILEKATAPWGVLVQRVEIKDVKLPFQMQRAMAAEAEASREAKAKVIDAEGELKASKALKEASDIMTENETALQLRYLQTLNTISTEKNSTILFPLPIDIFPPHFK